jgi:hypothetical protein
MSDNPITEQLKKVASDVLSEETLDSIEQAFNESVQSKAEELAQLRVEKALVEQDEEHSIKLEKLLEAIDTDHTNKLKRVVGALDKNHSQKLVALVEKFRKEIDGDAKMFKESLVDNISNYIDLYIEKAIPAEDIQEAVKNKHAMTVLESLRKSLSIDNALSNTQVREAVIDGKKQIDEANAALEVLRQENQVLKEQTESKDAKILIEQLTEGLPVTKKRHLEKVFSGKSAKFINENFQYTLDMFDKTEAEKLTTLKEDATAGKKIAERPTVEKKQVVQESVESQIEQSNPDNMQDTGLFNNYMGELNRW